MLMLSKKFVTNNMSPHNDPIAIAKSGDTVCFETRDCYDDRLHGDGSVTEPEKALENPATGPLYIEGAAPGDVLKVHIDRITINPTGLMRASVSGGAFNDLVEYRKVRQFDTSGDMVQFNDKLRFPIDTMIGVIGTAPATDTVMTHTPGLEDAAGAVIERHKHRAEEIGAHIAHRKGQNLLRRSHEPEQRGAAHRSQQRHDAAGDQGEGDGRAHGPPGHRAVLCAEAPGNDHAHAAEHSSEEAHHQKDQRAGGGDGSQRVLPQIIAHHQRIRHVVKLLKQLPQKQRQGKPQQIGPDLSVDQVHRLLSHIVPSPFPGNAGRRAPAIAGLF